LYENNKEVKEEESNEYEQDGMKIRMEHNKSDEKIFTNFKSGEMIAQRDLMGRMFLVKGVKETPKWKITDRQKNILDMPCQEAWYANETDTVTAWYTTAIPVSGGPKDLAGLPGMILEVSIGKAINIKAGSVNYTEDNTKKIISAEKGKSSVG
jgi:GLPGLI family protein